VIFPNQVGFGFGMILSEKSKATHSLNSAATHLPLHGDHPFKTYPGYSITAALNQMNNL
jgi:hypothetical protein